MNRSQVRAAWVFYQNGWSLSDIAEKIWTKYNYASKRACENSLRKAFKYYGMRRRDASQAALLSHRKHHGGKCSRCGIETSKRTVGCKTCTARMWFRKENNVRTNRFVLNV